MDKADFTRRKPELLGGENYKKYAVLAPVVDTADGLSLLFEVRSDTLRRQPGEICFPGGRIEPDESPRACAVREAEEELRISAKTIELFGPGDYFVSPYGFIVYPFIGRLHDYRGSFSADEVSEVFTVPLDFFRTTAPDIHATNVVCRLPDDFPSTLIPGGENYPWSSGVQDVYFYKYENRTIWGMTAKFARNAVRLIDAYRLI